MIGSHSRGGYPEGRALPMPEPYIHEMCTDWLGASCAYEGQFPTILETWRW